MFKEIKERQKERAIKIRELKKSRKLDANGNRVRPLDVIQLDIDKLKYEFRHTHIAYCEIRGRKREQIERPAENNLPNESYIEKIKKEILKQIEEYKETHLPKELFLVRSVA